MSATTITESPVARRSPVVWPWLVAGVAVAGLLVAYPPFRIVSATPATEISGGPSVSGAFDAAAAAAKIWATDFPAATDRAADLTLVAQAVRSDPAQARLRHARSVGLGAAYYFVRGRGRVVTREGSRVRLALDEAGSLIVELRLGPVFGNTVRDGCGLLDLNKFPGLQEFNTLATELNALVEKHVLPPLREQAVPGAEIVFAGCAEAPETAGDPAAPLLVLIPVKAEVRR